VVVAKYSEFGLIESCISDLETVQDRR